MDKGGPPAPFIRIPVTRNGKAPSGSAIGTVTRPLPISKQAIKAELERTTKASAKKPKGFVGGKGNGPGDPTVSIGDNGVKIPGEASRLNGNVNLRVLKIAVQKIRGRK